MSKNARWGQINTGAPNIVLAGQSTKAMELLAGKTLKQLGLELDLADEDVKWGFGINPQNQQEIRSLLIHHPQLDVWYQVPVSRGLTPGHWENPAVMLNCMFRQGWMSVKDETGAPKVDENGVTVLDESKPYLSFGRPAGITVSRMENVFDEPVEGSEEETAKTASTVV